MKLFTLIAFLCFVVQCFSTPVTSKQFQRMMKQKQKMQKNMKTPNQFDAKVGYFQQILDHSHSGIDDTFLQAYYYKDQYYRSGGPAFLVLQGITEEDFWVNTDNLEWDAIAQKTGAWVFILPHRFYGSTPTSDMSAGNLEFLSSWEAVEDAAFFIQGMVQRYPQLAYARWVTLGKSYGGNLAAWSRFMHPELVSFALSSSAPVQAQVAVPEFMEVVMNAIIAADKDCADSVTAGFNQIAQLIQTAAGRQSLKSAFNVCQDIDSTYGPIQVKFWEMLFTPYIEYVRLSGTGGTYFTIQNSICKFHNDHSVSVLDRMKNVNDYYDMSFGFSTCNDIDYNAYIQSLGSARYETPEGTERAWKWQQCTEFGQYITTESNTTGSWFGGTGNLPVWYYYNQCADIFGGDYGGDFTWQAVNKTNTRYGGNRYLNTSYTIFVNGNYDPFYQLSVLTSSNATVVPVMIDKTGQYSDFYPPYPNDNDSLKSARSKIMTTLIGWLGGV